MPDSPGLDECDVPESSFALLQSSLDETKRVNILPPPHAAIAQQCCITPLLSFTPLLSTTPLLSSIVQQCITPLLSRIASCCHCSAVHHAIAQQYCITLPLLSSASRHCSAVLHHAAIAQHHAIAQQCCGHTGEGSIGVCDGKPRRSQGRHCLQGRRAARAGRGNAGARCEGGAGTSSPTPLDSSRCAAVLTAHELPVVLGYLSCLYRQRIL